MEGNGSIRFEELAVNCREDSNVVIRPSSGTHNSIISVNYLVELPNYKGNRLDSLDLLLGSRQLALQIPHLILNVFFLNVNEFKLLRK